MKKCYLLIISCMMIVSMSFAQVAITTDGSSPDGSAMLDVKSTSKGLLIPRMTTAQRLAINAPAEGLMVYDSDLGVYCYRRIGAWKILVNESQGWLLTGNAATNPSLHFLGTTDTSRLMFKVNNYKAGTISTLGLTLFGYLAGYSNWAISNTFIGYMSGFANTTGSWNTALGSQSLAQNVDGTTNTALGAYTLFTNKTGDNNVAIGHQALGANDNGTDNTAAGFLALGRNTSGNENTAIGRAALYDNFTGSSNTAVGYNAEVSAPDLTNVTVLGNWAIATASNQVRLGNVGVTSLFCNGAYGTTSALSPNLVVSADGQIMRSTVSMLTGSGTNGQVSFWFSNTLNGNDNLFWNVFSNRLGIGTTTPAQKLTVNEGNIALTSTTSSSYGLQFYEPGTSGFNYSAFKAQQQAGDVTYTLPAAAATVDGQTLASTTTGLLSWSSAESPLTFQNGLTRTINNVKLGGTLSENTTITQDVAKTFTIANSGSGNTTVNLAGTGDFQIQDNGSAFLTATDDGKIGIGIAAPNQQLEITGSFRLPATTTATTGVIYKGGSPFIHDYKPPSNVGSNTFVGNNAGNFTMSSATYLEASYNTGIGYDALNDLTTGYENTAIGFNSLRVVTTGFKNTAFGSGTLYTNFSGNNNTAIGINALFNNTASNNTAIGTQALFANTGGSQNVVVGMGAGSNNQTGSNNILLGYQAGNALTSGSNNIIIGYDIDPPLATGSNQMVLGATDLFYGDLTNKRIGIGITTPNQQLEITGSFRLPATTTATTGVIYKGGSSFIHDYKPDANDGLNTFVGVGAGNFTMSGFPASRASNNTGIGNAALNDLTTGYHNTAVGTSSLGSATIGYSNTAVGSNALVSNTIGSQNVAVGMGAGINNQTGGNNVLLGYNTGASLTTGSNNIIIGANIDVLSATGNDQLVLGSTDLFYGDLFTNRIGIGTINPLQKLTVEGTFGILEGGASPTHHTIFQGGTQSADITYTLPVNDGATGQVLTSDGSGILSWSSVGSLTGTGTATRVAFWSGTSSLSSNASLYWDNTNSRLGIGTAVPTQQLELTGNLRLPVTTSTTGIIYAGANPFIHNFGTSNNFMGAFCGNLTFTTAAYNSAIGDSALYSITLGAKNVAFGQGALKLLTASTGNIAIGYGACRNSGTGAGYNTVVGFQAGIVNNTDRNTFLGCETGFANTTGHYNVFVGHQAGNKNTVANNCVALGYHAMYNQNGADGASDLNNVAVGFEALYSNNPISQLNGFQNVAIGSKALRANTTGFDNTSVGYSSSFENTTGYGNASFGSEAMMNDTTGYYNTAIGSSAMISNSRGNVNTAVGKGALATNTIGGGNTAIGCEADVAANNFINATAIGYQAEATASYQVRLGNDNVTSLYCMGAFVGLVGGTNRVLYADNMGKIGYSVSSARYKDNILDMESSDWLYQLRPVNFSYKTDEQKKKQYGLIAEEVEKINPAFVSYNKEGLVETVSYIQLISPMIKAIQEHENTISVLQSQVDQLKKDREFLMSRLEALEKGQQDLTKK